MLSFLALYAFPPLCVPTLLFASGDVVSHYLLFGSFCLKTRDLYTQTHRGHSR